MKKICHVTTVHPFNDPRIFYRECQSLSSLYKVFLIAPHLRNETLNGIKIIALPIVKFKIFRFLFVDFVAFFKSIFLNASVYHLHDPELIICGIFLRVIGKKVIYDVHEDYVTSIRNKSYIPKYLKFLFINAVKLFENIAKHIFLIVIAEKYYRSRFPVSTKILNYPLVNNEFIRSGKAEKKLLYTGNITENRGAFIIPELVKYTDCDIYVVGKCSEKTAKKMKEICNNSSALHIIGVNKYIDHNIITSYYKKYNWVGGLALFPDSNHYSQKELTKFFEYMYFGIPIIASDFPSWNAFIEANKLGKCFEPDNFKSIGNYINTLLSDEDSYHITGKYGYDLIRNEYNWKSQEQELFKLYSDL